MFDQVIVQLLCLGESALGEKFVDAVGLYTAEGLSDECQGG